MAGRPSVPPLEKGGSQVEEFWDEPGLVVRPEAVREGVFREDSYSIRSRHGGVRLTQALVPGDGPHGRENLRVLLDLCSLTRRWLDTCHTLP